MKIKRKIAIALCSLGLVLTMAMPFIFQATENIFMVKAEETQQEYDADFFSRANTYDASLTERLVRGSTSGEKYNSISYNMNVKRQNVAVSDDAPQVTFVTHGLNGNAAHWSNNSGNPDWDFAYSPGSIIDLLQQKADCNIYLVHFNSMYNFDLMQLNNYNYDLQVNLNNIIDNTKHSIVIFEGANTWQSNDYIYTQFNIMASKVVLDLQALDPNNELPRVNLIGHSRGGLTNLQYALDHPDLVDSIFSLGTPYLGSTSASIDNYILNGEFTNNSIGEDDITDPQVYLNYLNRWNNNYNTLYQDISVHALGGYQSIDMLIYQVVYPYIAEYLEEDIIDFTAKTLLKALNIYLSVRFGVFNRGPVSNVIAQEAAGGVLDIIYRFVPALKNNTSVVNGITAIFDLLFHELEFNSLTLSYDLLNDGLVDLPSQLGMDRQSNNSYIGFNRVIKRFGIFGKYNLDKSSTDDFRVTHNLEAQDVGLLSYIVKRINMSYGKNGTPYLVVDVSTAESPDSVSIIGYIGKNIQGTLTIPEKIYFDDADGNRANDEKTVISISTGAFADNMNGETGITGVIIPRTVKTIGASAFYNNEYLTTIDFNGASILEIGEAAFMGCSNLTDVSLPSTVVSIGNYAFANCVEIESIYIPSNVKDIGATAFVGCSQLSSISVDTANPYYSSTANGILFNKAGTELVYYPEGKTETSYVVPTSVTDIAPFAFYGNSKLATLSLNNVRMIRQYALSGCENLATIQAPNLNYMEIGAFDGTLWLENQTSDIVKLGNVLVLYQGTASELSIEGVTSIAPMAFAENETLETVTLNNGLVNIGDGAFYGCSNLETVYICNNSALIYVSNASFDANAEGRVIYVPYNLQEEYKNNELWKQYEDSIEVQQTNITYVLNGGNCDVTSGSVYYQDYLDSPTPNKNGNTFKGWYDNAAFTGNKLDEQTLWNSLAENVTFYAKWEENTYKALLHPKGGTVTPTEIEYKISDGSKSLPEPSRVGYTFKGWYESQDYSGVVVTEIPAGTYENKNYYAKWESIRYMVNLSLNYPNAQTGLSEHVKYGECDTITAPVRVGYNFLGWAYNGEMYTDNKGQLIEPWAFTETVTLVAQWQAKESKIVLSIGGNTVEYTVLYNGKIQLPIPTKAGYTFQAWCDETGKQYTNNSGMMTIPWDKETARVTLVSSWSLNTYTLSWVVPTTTYDGKPVSSGSYSISKTSTYTYESEVEMATINSIAYKLLGWYTTSTYDERTLVEEFSAGNYGNKTFYAKLAMKQYTLSFNSNGGTSCTSITVDYGTTVTLPISTKSNYKGSWDSWTIEENLPVSNFGNDYTVFYNKSFTASWKLSYNIVYGNLVFMGQTAELYSEKWLYGDVPDYYFYGYTFDLNGVRPVWQTSSSTSPQLVFLGWYTNMNFTTKVTSISASQTGNKIYYAKWRYDIDNPSRIGQYTIDNSDPLNQTYSDRMYVGLNQICQTGKTLKDELKSIGIRSLTFNLKLRHWGEGTARIFVYSDGGTSLWQRSFTPALTSISPGVYSDQVTLSLDALGTSSYIYMRYQATSYMFMGIFTMSHHWYNNLIYMEMSYVVEARDINDPNNEFTWHYQDPFENKG